MWVLWLGISLAWAKTTSPALQPGWMVDRWTVEDGLPLDHITDIAQTPDGFLWLATLDGLVRFDGERFQTLRRAELPGLPSNRLTALELGEGGWLWGLAETGEVFRLRGREIQAWPPLAGGRGAGFRLERVGPRLWVRGVEGMWPIEDREDGGAPNIDALIPGAWSILERGGVQWVATQEGVLREEGGRQARVPWPPMKPMTGIERMLLPPTGEPWLLLEGQVWRIEGGAIVQVPLGEPFSWVCDLDWVKGAPWVSTLSGWWRLDPQTLQPNTQIFSKGCPSVLEYTLTLPVSAGPNRIQISDKLVLADGLPLAYLGSAIRKLFVSAEGEVWIGGNGGGLLRARRSSVHTIPPLEGSPARWLAHVDPEGRVWTSGAGTQVVVIEGERERRLPLVTEGGPLPLPYEVLSFTEGAGGRPLVGMDQGWCQVAEEGCRFTAAPPQVGRWFTAIHEAEDGALWLGGREGLWVGRPEEPASWRELRLTRGEAGAPVGWVNGIVPAPGGATLLATRRWGVVVVRGASVEPVEGLGSQRVRGLRVEPDGSVWVGTEDAGLCWLPHVPAKGETLAGIRCAARREGLLADGVHAIEEDDQGRLWMSSNQGISWARREDLLALMRGEVSSVQSVSYDQADGMGSREANGGQWPPSGRTPDGRLWFPTQGGLVWIDPATISLPTPPPVSFSSVRLNQAEVLLASPIHLLPHQRELTVRWEASLLPYAARLQYRYRLAGEDDGWRGPDRSHQMTWTNLPAGTFTVEVQAGVAGVWGPISRLTVERRPAFRETPWFWGLAGVALVGVSTGGLALRTLALRRQQARLEAEVEARTQELQVKNLRLAEQAEDLARKNRQVQAQARRLAEVDALKTRFVASLSHELRTPMALLLGPLADLAPEVRGVSKRAQARLEVIENNAARLQQLIEQLFDLARLEEGHLPLRARRQELGGFLRALVARFAPDAEQRGVRLEVEAPPHPVWLWLDTDLMDKVISNLVGNALKFTPAGGSVRARLEALEEGARIEVVDSGVGIPPEEHARLFQRFYQVDREDDRKYEGAGIGLALAKELVELHGGQIGVESAPGRGSVFWVELPGGARHLAPEEVDLQASPARPSLLPEALPARAPSPAPLQPGWILVAEDHPEMRAYLVEHLQAALPAAQIEAVENGHAALERVRVGPRPGVIVSDVMMPLVDGLELCRRVRGMEEERATIPVVLISAKAGLSSEEAVFAGANAYLSKPFPIRALVDAVARLLPAPEAASEEGGLSPEDAALLERLTKIIQARMSDSAFGAEELAKKAGFSRRQLLREVQRTTQKTITDFIQQVRMEAAAARLRQPGATVGDVAASVGLSPSYFSRLYTASFGHPPSDDLLDP